MANRRVNPFHVKQHRSYTVEELASRLGVHKNTVRHWQKAGLTPNDSTRPLLFQGKTVRVFLAQRVARRKQPCGPGRLYCFRCRQPREPALGMVEYVELRPGSGNLRAMCGYCDTIMHRRAPRSALSIVMPGIAVQIREDPMRLAGGLVPCVHCDSDQ